MGSSKGHKKKAEADGIQKSRIIVFLSMAILFLVLSFISIYFGWFKVSEFGINILNNIIGILPPLLFFDYFYNKISDDSASQEMSKRLTRTMMGQPETLKLFNVRDRKNFLRSTVSSVIEDDDLTDMVLDNVNRYVIDPAELDVRIKLEFNYNFELDEELPNDYAVLLGDLEKAAKDYYLVQEILTYRAKWFKPEDEPAKREICIGLAFDNDGLDAVLRDKMGEEKFFIFREGLELKKADRERLRQYLTRDEDGKELSGGQMIERFNKLFRMGLKIDNVSVPIKEVLVKGGGIICTFALQKPMKIEDYTVRLIFSMPKRWGTIIEVALADPTYSPKVTMSYPRDKMCVEMYSFLNKCDETSLLEAHEQMNGVYDISLKEWVYPISGMVFTVNPTEAD